MINNNSKIHISNLIAYPYTPDSPVATEFPGFSLFTKQKDFVIRNSIRNIAIVFKAENMYYEKRNVTTASFRADVRSPHNEIIASKIFSIKMGKDSPDEYKRIDMPLFGDSLYHGIYKIEIHPVGTDNSIPVAETDITLYNMPRLPIRYFTAENACFITNDMKMISVDSSTVHSLKLKMKFNHTFYSISNLLPEFKVRLLDGIDEQGELFPATLEETTSESFILTADIRLPENAPDVMMVQVKAFNMRISGFAFETTYSSPGELNADEIIYIPGFTVEKGRKEISLRKKRMTDKKEAESYEKAEEQLNALIGLENVKQNITAQTNFVTFNRLRVKQGLPEISRPLHSLFLGAPGTGKTTVASLIGKLLHKAGALSSGHVVFRERANLVGKYYNSESENIQSALKEAKGGILFIDEAYQLYQPADPKDPGMMVLNSLMTILADTQKRDWMLILAGYTEPMLEMLEQNPGLSSRFPESNRHIFNSFTLEELQHIALQSLKKYKLNLNDSAKRALFSRINADYSVRDNNFGNARYIVNLIETEIIPAMANRLANLNHTPSEEELSNIAESDIPASQNRISSITSRKKIGFNIAA